MNLAPYIRELIALNECIILPEFGGFETTYVSAEYDAVNKCMRPPSKSISFKSEYTVGGEIIEQHLTVKLGLNSQEANKIITDYVSEIKEQLISAKEFEIEEVGKFQLDNNGQIHFTSFEEENYLVDSFGLEPLPYQESQIEPRPEQIRNKVFNISSRSNTLTFVISGIILISLLLALTVFISARFNLYLFNIGDSSINSDVIIIGGNHTSDSTYIQIEKRINETTSVKNALQFTEPTLIQPVQSTTFYILVAGSFKGFNNAQELQSKLKKDGFNVEIVEAGGYYRVSIGRFANKLEALSELKRIRTQINRSVWLLTISEP